MATAVMQITQSMYGFANNEMNSGSFPFTLKEDTP